MYSRTHKLISKGWAGSVNQSLVANTPPLKKKRKKKSNQRRLMKVRGQRLTQCEHQDIQAHAQVSRSLPLSVLRRQDAAIAGRDSDCVPLLAELLNPFLNLSRWVLKTVFFTDKLGCLEEQHNPFTRCRHRVMSVLRILRFL